MLISWSLCLLFLEHISLPLSQGEPLSWIVFLTFLAFLHDFTICVGIPIHLLCYFILEINVRLLRLMHFSTRCFSFSVHRILLILRVALIYYNQSILLSIGIWIFVALYMVAMNNHDKRILGFSRVSSNETDVSYYM